MALRRLTIMSCALLFAACAPIQQKPEPIDRPSVRVDPSPKRFDGLAAMAHRTPPERDGVRNRYRYQRLFGNTDIEGLRFFFYEPDGRPSVVGFSVQNTGSPKINPVGLKRSGPWREFAFRFADRAREDIHLTINDDVKVSGRFSHDNMFRELHFFPRRQLPSLEVDQRGKRLRITLPTGEPVEIDLQTKELAAGVLTESPIDFNRSRHKRHNPRVSYRGKYLAITVAQRGEAPRRAKVWGQRKFAEVHYPTKYGKPCRVSPKHIWDQRPKPGDSDPKLTMLHKSDSELFDVIERRCGWDLTDLRASQRLLLGTND